MHTTLQTNESSRSSKYKQKQAIIKGIKKINIVSLIQHQH